MPPTTVDDPQQPLGQGPRLHHTITQVAPTLSLDLDQPYHPWSQLAPTYPYRSPLAMDGGPTDLTTAQYTEAAMQMQETNPHLLLEDRTTAHFPSTHPHHPHPHPRRSPSMQGPSPILVSDPTADPTTMTTMEHTATGSASEEAMFAHLAALGAGPAHLGPPAGMSTGPSLDPSLDGSPSWSSAMTPMLSQQLDHLYHYQAQRQHSVHHGPPRHPDSSQVHSSSHSMTGHHPPSPPHPGSNQALAQAAPARSTPSLPPGAHHYSAQLRRQQEEQLRRIQLQAQQRHQEQAAAAAEQHYQAERARRTSAEEQYLLHMAEAYRRAGSGGGVPPPTAEMGAGSGSRSSGHSPHGHPYYPAPVYGGDMAHLPDGDLDRLALDMDGQAYGHHPQQAVYPLVDGPLHPLDLQEASPTGLIKYESQLE